MTKLFTISCFLSISLQGIAWANVAKQLPWCSYKCNSTATLFYKKNNISYQDSKSVIVGYVDLINVGLVSVTHELDGKKFDMGVQTGTSRKNNDVMWASDALYTRFDENIDQESYFSLYNSKLSHIFRMFLTPIEREDYKVFFELNCVEKSCDYIF